MLAKATEPKPSRAKVNLDKLAVAPRTIFDAVRANAGDRVLCEPVDARWFGRLGGVLKSLPSFVPADVQLLVDWLNAGGCRSWPQGVPTFGHLIAHLDKWTAFAREWDRRGRNELWGKTAVGAAMTADATDFSAFKVPRLE